MMLQEIVNNPKTGHVVGTATAAIGSSTWLGWIPDDIGKLATLIGLILSAILIRNHWRKGKIEYEILLLEKQEKMEAAKQRKKAGLPLRKGEEGLIDK